ncbi:TPA: WYL domain-containing protein, partial [Escherichia coli]
LLGILLGNTKNNPFLIKQRPYENCGSFMSILNVLSDAILSQKKVNFNYKDKEFRAVEAYRLVNDKGLWYLAASHNSTLKSFVISSIKDVCVSNIAFSILPEINEKIEKTDGIWYGEDLIEVLISVSAHVAPWFTRRHLLPRQEIIHTSWNGDLLIISRVAHTNQIIPLMKYWMPDIEVIRPLSVRQQLTEDIQSALKRYTQPSNAP